MDKVKILIIGEFKHYMYEEAFSDTLKKLNYEVHKFQISKYIENYIGKFEFFLSLKGPIYYHLNKKI